MGKVFVTALAFWTVTVVQAGAPRARVLLPVEITGPAGTTAAVTLELPPGTAPRTLWLQVHGVSFAGMASVQINDGNWVALTNDTVTIMEPGASYGGIGGAFATLQMTYALMPNEAYEGPNTIRFRFNQTNGVASGFRVLAFHFRDADGHDLPSPTTFTQEDPSVWTPPFDDAQSIAKGADLWRNGPLTADGRPGAGPIRAHCGDCHTRDGRDLKYFNFSNASIVERSRFHGLTELEGQQIASYIRTLAVPNPGRPWNPPYQPGPGLDAKPVSHWAAGAGLEWVLNHDAETIPYLLNRDNPFRPDASWNARETPIAMQLPDWNHWLPRVHPLDFRAAQFERSGFSQPSLNDKWLKARNRFLPTPKAWTPELGEAYYSAQLWQLVKTWEMMQEQYLEQALSWSNTFPAATAPASVNIPNGPNGMNGTALVNEYFNNAWYELQIVLNSGDHRHHGKTPVDWPYLIRRFLELQQQSHHPEPGRLLVAVIKAMQWTDPAIGPESLEDGWRPERTVDPRLLVDKQWTPVFDQLSPETRRTIAEAMLTAWLDKNEQYTTASYFERGRSAKDYTPSKDLRDVFGGRAWEAAAQFRALGVKPTLVRRLEAWGKAYTAMAELFHY